MNAAESGLAVRAGVGVITDRAENGVLGVKMKAILSACTVLALSVGIALSSTAASASNGAGTSFKASYLDGAFGTVDTCAGSHVVQADGTVKDSETCVMSGDTSKVVAGTFVGNPTYCFASGCFSWLSDFNGVIAKTVTLTFVANGDGTFTEYVVAYYTAPVSNGASTPFKASYVDPAFGTLDTCAGNHIVQSNGTVKDSETCILSGDTSLVVAGTFKGRPSYCFPSGCFSWVSDFDGVLAKTVTLTFVANGDGTFTEYAVAYY